MLPDIVTEWLQKAEEDYGFACAGMEHTEYFAQICFHFQQAAEKYLKAFIIANGLDFRPVHSLFELLSVCKQTNVNIRPMEKACQFLNSFYIDTRYPVHWPTAYDRATAAKAKQMAEDIRDWVTRYISV